MLRLDINLLFTIINLLILYFLLKRFLFKPVRNILAKRDEEIRKSYADADKAKQDADALKQQYEQTMQGIETEKQARLADARKQADAEYAKTVAEAGKKSDEIIAQAKDRAAAEAEREKQKASQEIADMVKAAAAKAVAASPGDGLYDSFLSQVDKAEKE